MFLRFAVSNHLSIHESQELFFVASSLKDQDEGLLKCAAAPSGYVLPALVVYGGNASGKTNLVSAIDFVRDAVLYSHTRVDAMKAIRRLPFRLDVNAETEHTHCEVDFMLNGLRHQYGFTVSSERYESEWLYYFPSSHRRRLFDREGDEFQFGRDLRGQNVVISNLTRPDSLFVSAAAQNSHDYLTQVVALFQSIEILRNLTVPSQLAIARLNEEGDIDSRVIDFLRDIGTGVEAHEKKEVSTTDHERLIHREVNAMMSRLLDREDEFPDVEESKVIYELAHKSSDGSLVTFELERESSGTRRLLLILSAVFKAIDYGTLIVVDELDASLHTHVCELILGLFSKAINNEKGAQLLATTHDTNLMRRWQKRSHPLRRDQLWFVAKNDIGATELYPLTDFKTRKNDDFERGYLEGRFGAVPNRN